MRRLARPLRAHPAHGGIDHHLAQGRACGFFAAFEPLIQRAPHDARIGGFGVAELAGLVDLVAAQSEIGRGGFNVAVSNLEISPAAVASHLAPRLRGIVFVGQATLGAGLDLQRMGLRAMRRRDEIVMGALRSLQPGGAFRHIVGQPGHLARLEHLGGGLRAREHAGGAVDQAGKVL